MRELLGHANIATTSRYLNVTEQGLLGSMRRFDEGRQAPALPTVANAPGAEHPLVGNTTGPKVPQPRVN